jgi:hypothetical protein
MLPHDVETTICWQTLLKLKIYVEKIHYILSHDTHDVIPYNGQTGSAGGTGGRGKLWRGYGADSHRRTRLSARAAPAEARR